MALLAWAITILAVSCKKEPETAPRGNAHGIKPEDFPATGIAGFSFPEDSTVIYNWLEARDTTSITQHAWGIWAGLTQQSGQVFQGDSLRVFETWLGVEELQQACAEGNADAGCTSVKAERTQLSVPKQFIHAQTFANAQLRGNAPIDTTFQVFETVAYSPAAACYATEKLIFNQSSIDKYQVNGGIGRIPNFPVDGITTKPTYYAGKVDGEGLIRVPVWPGTPNPAKAYGYSDWKTYVYADTKNGQQPGRKLRPVNTPNPSDAQIDAATCNLNDFIHYRIDKEMADYLNKHEDPGSTPFVAGDMVLLVAMHVGTKEISNWTWQTFFWTYEPDAPPAPSSAHAARLRPAQLKGAAAHYAVSTAYTMVWPNQPITGGSGKGTQPQIAFNPYLEGSFGPRVFNIPNTDFPTYQYGVQTNCMSCHALASTAAHTGYSTTQYIDMKDLRYFKDGVQADFAWSIIDNLNKDK